MFNAKGFTLIELVMVIVILGLLAAMAIPKFIDLKTEARAADLQEVVGAISSASAVNYASRSVDSRKGAATLGLTCRAAAAVILEGAIPSGYILDNVTPLTAGPNTCVVTQADGGATANATIIGIP